MRDQYWQLLHRLLAVCSQGEEILVWQAALASARWAADALWSPETGISILDVLEEVQDQVIRVPLQITGFFNRCSNCFCAL